jgi:hypothetical protein
MDPFVADESPGEETVARRQTYLVQCAEYGDAPQWRSVQTVEAMGSPSVRANQRDVGTAANDDRREGEECFVTKLRAELLASRVFIHLLSGRGEEARVTGTSSRTAVSQRYLRLMAGHRTG